MKRMFRTVRLLAAWLAIGSPALGASDPDELLLLAGQMRNAHYARVGVAGRTMVLVDPGVTTSGLVYRRIEGFPRQRPALFAGADWDSVPAPPNPIPWESLDRIEAGYYDRTQGAAVGAVVGLVVSLAAASLAASDNRGYAPWAYVMYFGAPTSMLLGAAIGAMAAGPRWQQLQVESDQ